MPASIGFAPPAADAALRDLRWMVENFYYAYADVLDMGDIERWPDFFTDDAVYRVTGRDNADANLRLGLIYCEGMAMLKDRAFAIAHTEMFAPRYLQHHISNVRVLSIDGTIIRAQANYLLLETVTDEPTRLQQAGRYYDRLRWTGERLLIEERQCVYDTIIIPNCIVYPI